MSRLSESGGRKAEPGQNKQKPTDAMTSGLTAARDEEEGCGVGWRCGSKLGSSQKDLDREAQCLVLVAEQAETDGQSH